MLMASQSVSGTIESQIVLQRLSLIGVNLLFLWALSPLGGQASLRLMTRRERLTTSESKLRYMTTGPGGAMWGLSSTYMGNGKFGDAEALYTAALLAPLETKTGPVDPWGNVKVPRLKRNNTTRTDAEGWITVSRASKPEDYSSLVGLPIVGLPENRTANFNMESTYLTVECAPFNQMSWATFNETVPGKIWPNEVESTNPFEPLVGRSTSFFLDTTLGLPWVSTDPMYDSLVGRLDGFFGHYNKSRSSEGDLLAKRELIYTSRYKTKSDMRGYALNVTRCLLAQQHVEIQVECGGGGCQAQSIRESRTDTRSLASTAFEHITIMRNFALRFPIAVPSGSGSSPTEFFLANTTVFPFPQKAGQLDDDVTVAVVDLSLVTPEDFSKRLSLLLNTYYQLTIQPTGYYGGLPQNLSRYGPDTAPATDINAYLPGNFTATNNSFFDWWPVFDQAVQLSDHPFIGATTTGLITSKQEVFLCNTPWLVLLMISATVIFIVGGVALLLKHRTLGPEMFGFVTSMTYENPWMKISQGGTTLDAMERARLLRDIEVHVGDVCGDEDIGHIAFAAGVPLRNLEKGRLYC
jgi:hypothetical protein